MEWPHLIQQRAGPPWQFLRRVDKRTVAVIFDRLGPYHIARLTAAAELLHVAAIEICATSDEYAWDRIDEVAGFHRKTLFSALEGDSGRQNPASIRDRVEAALHDVKSEAVFIPGWATPAALTALRWCLDNKRPAILMSETTAFDEPRRWFREAIKGRIVRLFSAALVGGKPHADYLAKLRFPIERVFTGYDVVDNEYFARTAKEVSLRPRGAYAPAGSQQSEIRKKHNLPQQYFLASARFIEKKNLFVLLRAYADYHSSLVTRHLSPWSLILLGDGPLKSDLDRLISDLGLRDSVVLSGFIQYPELPSYYGLANAFLHTSTTEQWGLVVNEAMASRLPVIVSNRCGCAPELVVEGENGFTFDPTSISNLTKVMLDVSSLSTDRLETMGQASQRIIAGFTPKHFATGAAHAVDEGINAGERRANKFDSVLLNALIHKCK